MENKPVAVGHMAALITILIWGTTFISTKILLEVFSPVEILLFRFTVGLAALFLIYPRPFGWKGLRKELLFAAAGLTGVTLYFLLQNIALTYSLASNIGVIVSVAPFFTALLARRFLKEEQLGPLFFVGFAAAMAGIILIAFNGNFVLELNPLGDLLTVLAAGTWAIYSILTRRIGEYGFHNIPCTRRIFTYGLLFMLPVLLAADFHWGWERFTEPVYLFNILFLGLGASALCFATWNFAVRVLGAVKTSAYIYGSPVVTIITSVIVLGEQVTWIAAVGTLLTLTGLFLSELQHRKNSSEPE